MFSEFFQSASAGPHSLFTLLSQMGNSQGFPFEDIPPHNQPQRPEKPPPASKRAIDTLPLVQVTADDLIEETNKECLICLEPHVIGSTSCKLPCGHLMHKPCLTEWLVKQCTCPVCRYELETDDSQYELARKSRMKNRKLRFRKDELKGKSVSQLKEICAKLSISTSDCLDKQEIIDKIVHSGKIILTDGLPPITLTEEEFNAKNVAELKQLLLTFGLSSDGALEKSELRARLLESGRIRIGDVNSEETTGKRAFDEFLYVNTSSTSGVSSTSEFTAAGKGNLNNPGYSRSELQNMSLSALRTLCKRYNIDISQCLDKSEVIDSLIRSRVFPIRSDNAMMEADSKEHSPPSGSNLPPPTSSSISNSPFSFLSGTRSRSRSQDESRKSTPSRTSSRDEPTMIFPPFGNHSRSQEPNYMTTTSTPEYYNHETLDQAVASFTQFLNSAANDITSHLHSAYQHAQRSRSNSSHSNSNSINSGSQQSSSLLTNQNNNSSSVANQQRSPPSSQVGIGARDETIVPSSERLTLSRELLESLNIMELKMILESYGLNTADCVDRIDHIELLQRCPHVEIID